MPALTPDNLTIETFEARMSLRRRMFGRSGVSVAALSASRDLAPFVRESVHTCLACESSEICAAWLDSASTHTGVPAFCANRQLIRKLAKEDPDVPSVP
ncbi:DUF6455 family protein [Roseovarius sp. D22-M7]|uniref:DUF6455 family protein n=1 Tax=Roseovarius sp. D22-M7 TaxID=3127116 RepID=UPI00300FE492